MNNKSAVMNYDPNLVLCGRTAKQIVRLTFGQWEYRGVFDVAVMGNISGLDVIRVAVENLYESLPCGVIPFDDIKYAIIELGELTSNDEDLRGEEWLFDMLIGAEIISIEPGKPL
ncbi:DUF5406 family protein [Pectobacterium odoriferum]|uniref:DUF5406 family protein n=1 Tax=Pectobacterium odoriferum TaxID=78398 RepID=UPI0032EC5786